MMTTKIFLASIVLIPLAVAVASPCDDNLMDPSGHAFASGFVQPDFKDYHPPLDSLISRGGKNVARFSEKDWTEQATNDLKTFISNYHHLTWFYSNQHHSTQDMAALSEALIYGAELIAHQDVDRLDPYFEELSDMQLRQLVPQTMVLLGKKIQVAKERTVRPPDLTADTKTYAGLLISHQTHLSNNAEFEFAQFQKAVQEGEMWEDSKVWRAGMIVDLISRACQLPRHAVFSIRKYLNYLFSHLPEPEIFKDELALMLLNDADRSMLRHIRAQAEDAVNRNVDSDPEAMNLIQMGILKRLVVGLPAR